MIAMPPVQFLLLWSLALLLVGAVVTEVAIRYAHWRGLIDEQGQRRSHVGRIPRGGGIAVVAALLLGCALLWGAWLEAGWLLRFVLALGLVAAIGWLDDHRPQPVAIRLLVQTVAAVLLLWPGAGATPVVPGWLPLPLAVLALVVALNFWNFMDGIDGLASLQAVFVGALLAHAFWQAGQPGLLLLALALVAGALGFLPFNLPRARIFLGDVGSGAIGFAIGALLLAALAVGALDIWTALLLPMAFWLDAGLTLLSRIVLGRRWYTAHREHLYQWLVRRGRSHLQVDALFLGWNLLIVLPAYLLIASRLLPTAATVVGLTLIGTLVWFAARRRLLRDARLYGYS